MASVIKFKNMLRRLKPIFDNSELLSKLYADKIRLTCRCYCTGSKNLESRLPKNQRLEETERDPFVIFMQNDVQTLLKQLTGFNPARAFKAFKGPTNRKPVFTFLTDNELEAEQKKLVKRHGWRKFQMPPFMAERKPQDHMISDDSDIAPAIKSKIVFVDISWKNRRIMGHNERPIVCRHTDGKLRWADWDQVDRMNQMFDPVEGRELVMPKMFEDEHLEKSLKEEQPKYRYILERACVQFEPDSDDFIRVTRRVYEEIALRGDFRRLRSTRFYGPMVFYYCWVRSISPLLIDLLQQDMLLQAERLIELFDAVDPTFKLSPSHSPEEAIQQFADYAKEESLPGWRFVQLELEKRKEQEMAAAE